MSNSELVSHMGVAAVVVHANMNIAITAENSVGHCWVSCLERHSPKQYMLFSTREHTFIKAFSLFFKKIFLLEGLSNFT